jgi:hypothetical protein
LEGGEQYFRGGLNEEEDFEDEESLRMLETFKKLDTEEF